MKKVFTLLFFIVLVFSNSNAQNLDSDNWKVFTGAKEYQAICEINGSLWVGYDGGITILSFEGKVVDYITKANSGLPTNTITQICVDSSNVVWIGTPEGLVKFDGENWEQFYNKNSPLQSNRITALVVDKDSKLWVGTEKIYNDTASLFYIEDGTWKIFDHSLFGGGIYGNPVNVLVSSENQIWIGYSTKLFKRISDSQFVSQDISLMMTGTMPEINNYTIDKDDNIWIAANGPIAEYSKAGTWNIWDESNSPFYDTPKKLFLDNNNNPWVGTAYNGIYRKQGNMWVKYDGNDIGINYNTLNSFYNSSDGMSYFGCKNDFYKFEETQWNKLNLSNSGLISSNFCNGIEVSESGIMYVTNNGFLLSMNKNQWDTLFSINGELKKITFDRNGNLLITSYDNGLIKYNITTTQSFLFTKENSALNTNRINVVEVEKGGKVWIGTHGGGVYSVDKIDDLLESSKVINYTSQNSSLPHNAVISIEKNELTEEIWFGCDWYGCAKFDGNSWEVYSTDNTPFTYPQIKSIVADKEGKVWLSTNNELCSYFNGEWKIELQNGIAVLETDNNGNVWAGRNEHLYKFNNDGIVDYNSRFFPFPDLVMELKVDLLNNLWVAGRGVAVQLSDSTSTSVKSISSDCFDYRLSQNYPNPFNPTTIIKYTIPQNTHPSIPSRALPVGRQEGKERSDRGVLVTLKVYDILGKEVATLVNKEQPAGNYEIEFNANNLSSGIYFYRLQSSSFVETKKMILLR